MEIEEEGGEMERNWEGRNTDQRRQWTAACTLAAAKQNMNPAPKTNSLQVSCERLNA